MAPKQDSPLAYRQGIGGNRTVTPEPEGVAQFVKSCGLQGFGPKLRGDHHLHLGLQSPAAKTLHVNDLKLRSSVARPPYPSDLTPRRTLTSNQHIGPLWAVHHRDWNQCTPGGQRG